MPKPCDCPDRLPLNEERVLARDAHGELRMQHRQCFTFTDYSNGSQHTYDVYLAQKLVAALPHPTAEIPAAELLTHAAEDAIDVRHLDHVDTSKPGIAVPFGGQEGAHVVIDGFHRAAALAREDPNAMFTVYLLCEAEVALIYVPQDAIVEA